MRGGDRFTLKKSGALYLCCFLYSALAGINTLANSPELKVQALRLISPKPSAKASFGDHGWLELPNQRLAVADPHYDNKRGALHVYDTQRGHLIKTFGGPQAGSYWTSGGLFKLNDDLVAFSSPWDGSLEDNKTHSGSLTLIDVKKLRVVRHFFGGESHAYMGGPALLTKDDPVRDRNKENHSRIALAAEEKRWQIFVASPDAHDGRGRIDMISSDSLQIKEVLRGQLGDRLGSGGLHYLNKLGIVAVKSPQASVVVESAETPREKSGRIHFLDASQGQLLSIYPEDEERPPPMAHLIASINGSIKTRSQAALPMHDVTTSLTGQGPIVQTGPTKVATAIVLNSQLVLVNLDLKLRRRNSDKSLPSTASLTASVQTVTLGQIEDMSNFRFDSVYISSTDKVLMVASPHITNSLKAPRAGEVHFIDKSRFQKVKAISGYFSDDYFAERLSLHESGALLAFAPKFDAVKAQDPSQRISDIGLVRIYNANDNHTVKDIWGTRSNDQAGLFGGIVLNDNLAAIDAGASSVKIINIAAGDILHDLRIVPLVKDSHYQALASPKLNRLAIMSSKLTGHRRLGTGSLYWVDSQKGIILNSFNSSLPSVGFGSGGIYSLSTGDLVVHNPDDSSMRHLSAGSLWIVRFSQ